MRLSPDPKTDLLDLEYDAEQTLWRSADLDRGTALLQILGGECRHALRAMHRHVILRNALRRPQNLAQILLFVGFGGGVSEILPVDDIVAEIVKEGAAGDGDLHIVCRWDVDRDGRHVFAKQPGRMIEVKRTIKLEDLLSQSSSLVEWVDDCASEADRKDGTWLRRRAGDVAPNPRRLERATMP